MRAQPLPTEPHQDSVLVPPSRKELGHTCARFSSGKNPERLRAPQNSPVPGILGQLLASLGHPVCRKTSDSCRRVARASKPQPLPAADKGPALLLQQFRPRSPRGLPVPELCPASFQLFWFLRRDRSSAARRERGFAASCGAGVGKEEGGNKGDLKAPTRRGFLGFLGVCSHLAA